MEPESPAPAFTGTVETGQMDFDNAPVAETVDAEEAAAVANVMAAQNAEQAALVDAGLGLSSLGMETEAAPAADGVVGGPVTLLPGVPTPAGYPGGPEDTSLLFPPTVVGLENQAEAQPLLSMASMGGFGEDAFYFAAALVGGKEAWDAQIRRAMEEGPKSRPSKKQRVMSFL